MEYQSDVEDSKILKANPSSKMKSVAMIIPTPNKFEITGKRIFSKVVKLKMKTQK